MMKRIMLIISALAAVFLIASCATVSLAAPTAEEAKAYEEAYSEVLASAGFGGVVSLIGGDGLSSEYKAGDKIGLFTVTDDSHIKMEIDLSGMLKGDQSIRFDIDVSYRTVDGTEKSVVYVAETGRGEDGGNETILLKAALNGKEFDPAAMQAMLS